jgi:prepilin-type processing-associated H-X9-DG protein
VDDFSTPCGRKLQRIAIAMLNYENKYHRFPPAYTVDKQGRRTHSWRVLILEFLDLDLYAQYDFSRPWNSRENLAFAMKMKMKKDGPYCCPAQDIKDALYTSYVMPVGSTAFSNGPPGRKLEEITDGLSDTLMVVEMSPSGVLWTEPCDLDVSEVSFKINDPDRVCLRGHPGGANVVFADGHVEFLSQGKSADDEAHLKAITTINGGEDMKKFGSE